MPVLMIGVKCSRFRAKAAHFSGHLPTAKCTFSGVVSVDLKRFQDSGVPLVECPDCARTRSLTPHKGVLRFPSHDQRKIQTPNTMPRWVRGQTGWDPVGAERPTELSTG